MDFNDRCSAIKRRVKFYYYKAFASFFWYLKVKKRQKIHKKINQKRYELERHFKRIETELRNIKYPNNNLNKIMSMVFSDIQLFGYIANRFRRDRRILSYISKDDSFLHFLGPKKQSYPAHPYEDNNNKAIKIDAQSLFVFGTILINRSLLLLKMFFSDRSVSSQKDMYEKIGRLYYGLVGHPNLSVLAKKFKQQFLPQIKWLYSVLRFYRNEFIVHLDRSYQQGMNYGVVLDDFTLSSYKWDYDVFDDRNIENFKAKLEKRGIKIISRSDGGRSAINRSYIQRLFNNIIRVPDDMLKEALRIVEDIGVDSPQPEEIISGIESYVEKLFDFMIKELNNSELAKYKNALGSRKNGTR